MKLSDAIVKGSATVKLDAQRWLSPDHSCGCLIGMAMVGEGLFFSDWPNYSFYVRWPWLERKNDNGERMASVISALAVDVARDQITLEEAIDQIRLMESVMDPSPEPEVKLEYKETVNVRS